MQQVDLQSQIETMPIDELRAQFDYLMNETVVFYQDNKEEKKAQDEQQEVKRQAVNGVSISGQRLHE